jgi:hypothetical protein
VVFGVERTACDLSGGWPSLGRKQRLHPLHSTLLFARAGLACYRLPMMSIHFKKSRQFLFPCKISLRVPSFNSHVQYCTATFFWKVMFHVQSTGQYQSNSVCMCVLIEIRKFIDGLREFCRLSELAWANSAFSGFHADFIEYHSSRHSTRYSPLCVCVCVCEVAERLKATVLASSKALKSVFS